MITLPPSRYGAATPDVRYGEGALAALRGCCRGRVAVFTDADLLRVDPVQDAIDSVEGAHAVLVWPHVAPNPTSASISRAAEVVAAWGPDTIVALGGGSVLDTAKATALLLAAGGRMEDHAGPRSGALQVLPIVAVPTTAGTGSELQSFALISREDGTKMACGHPAMMPSVVLLDPALPRTCPADVASAAWLDAVVHAVETAVCNVRTAASEACALAAARELAHGDPLLGAALAGAAIEASMLGAAHALGNPLTAGYHLPHGLAVALMAPHVVRFNAEAADYGPLAEALGTSDVARWLEDQLDARLVPRALADYEVHAADLPELARAAMEQWTGRFNPRPLDLRAVERLYAAALGA